MVFMVSPEQSYQGKAKLKLDAIKLKLTNNNEFTNSEISFLSSIGETFPIYDHISLKFQASQS